MSEKPTFKSRLRQPGMLHGFFIGMPSPATVEMVGYAGFDFVIIDTEHSVTTLESLENMLRAADCSGCAALVRVPSGSEADILHVLDAGATGILVPHVSSAAKAREIVQRSYYPPLGQRGIGTMSRAARHGLGVAADYLRNRNQVTTVIAMVEEAAALPEVGAIAKVEGIDAVFIGPSDLSASMGYLGDPGNPAVAEAIAGVRRDVMAANGPAVATIGRAVSDAARLKEQGVKMVCYSTTAILAAGLKELAAGVKAL